MSERATVTVNVSDLTPHPENYNTHPTGQISELAESLDMFGQFKNIVAWSPASEIPLPDGRKLSPGVRYILAGHGLWMAAMERGLDTIEIKDYTGLPYEDALLLMKADNAAPLGSVVDRDKLATLLQKTRGLLEDRPGLRAMVERLREREGIAGGNGGGNGIEGDTEPQIDRAAELAKEWSTAVGQVWQLGPHRLVVGDCTDPAVVALAITPSEAALVVTDPPYGVSYADKNKWLNAIARGNHIQTPIENDHDSKEVTQAMWKAAFKETAVGMAPGAVIYCFMPQGGDQMMMMMMMMMMGAGIEPRHELIWLKNNHVLGRVDYAYKHEPILYAWKDGGHKFYGGFQTSILEFPKPQKSDLHPTMKPVPLIERLIENSSKPGDIIFDPFVGSGTTIIAAYNLGRIARAVELDPGYAAVCLQRFRDHTGITPELINNAH